MSRKETPRAANSGYSLVLALSADLSVEKDVMARSTHALFLGQTDLFANRNGKAMDHLRLIRGRRIQVFGTHHGAKTPSRKNKLLYFNKARNGVSQVVEKRETDRRTKESVRCSIAAVVLLPE